MNNQNKAVLNDVIFRNNKIYEKSIIAKIKAVKIEKISTCANNLDFEKSISEVLHNFSKN
jgi:hypothetical protein